MNARVKAKLFDCERIAHELHVAPLRGMQGLMFTFQSVAERIQADALAPHRTASAWSWS